MGQLSRPPLTESPMIEIGLLALYCIFVPSIMNLWLLNLKIKITSNDEVLDVFDLGP